MEVPEPGFSKIFTNLTVNHSPQSTFLPNDQYDMMTKYLLPNSIILMLVLLVIPVFVPAQIQITPDHEDGVYNIGETIVWNILIDSITKYDSLRYAIKPGAMQVAEQGLLMVKSSEAKLSYKFQKPGSVILEIRWGNPGDWLDRVVSGGICAPEALTLSTTRPEDFDEFWQNNIAELEEIPMNPWIQSQSVEDTSISYTKVVMDNIRGSKIQAQMAMPNTCEKYPALLIVQWAGVYAFSKEWVTHRAKEGWLALNINPHDLPIDQKNKFYQQQSKNELKDYWAIGNQNRDSSYFLRMYLSCYRAIEYLKSHPSWNGQTIVVTGDSQGGQQTLVTAGLHSDVTAAMALVPAGFDMLGPAMGRRGGWPQWYGQIEGKDSIKVREASRYYDVANFIPNIQCPVLVGVGLLDETCPAEGILAGMNQLSQKKEIVLLPLSQHQDRNGSQAPYRNIRDQVWLPLLKSGNLPLDKK